MGNRRFKMKKLNVAYSLSVILAIMFLFNANAVFAETTLAELKAKQTMIKNAGVITLADLKAQLKKSEQQAEFSRNEEISERFGTDDLQAMRLTSDAKGNSFSKLIKRTATDGLKGLTDIVHANGYTFEQCEKLPVGAILYVPTKRIKKDLVLNAFEVAQLKAELQGVKEEKTVLQKKNNSLQDEGRALLEELSRVETAEASIVKEKEELEKKLAETITAQIQTEKKTGMQFGETRVSFKMIAFALFGALVFVSLILLIVFVLYFKSKSAFKALKEEQETIRKSNALLEAKIKGLEDSLEDLSTEDDEGISQADIDELLASKKEEKNQEPRKLHSA